MEKMQDSPMYHYQIIKWLYNYKITLGLTNLEIRFGTILYGLIFWHYFNLNLKTLIQFTH